MISLVSQPELDPNELLVFADDDRESPAVVPVPWQVLAVIDDDAAHRETRRVVEQVQFLGRPVSLLTAYSAAEAAARLRDNPAVAVILLDVAVESAAVNLNLVRTIRENLGNRCVRIIIRSNDSKATPPTEMLARYDISGYQSKDELTARQQSVAITAAAPRHAIGRNAKKASATATGWPIPSATASDALPVHRNGVRDAPLQVLPGRSPMDRDRRVRLAAVAVGDGISAPDQEKSRLDPAAYPPVGSAGASARRVVVRRLRPRLVFAACRRQRGVLDRIRLLALAGAASAPPMR
jgi:CheY-like chemotaxis protein